MGIYGHSKSRNLLNIVKDPRKEHIFSVYVSVIQKLFPKGGYQFSPRNDIPGFDVSARNEHEAYDKARKIYQKEYGVNLPMKKYRLSNPGSSSRSSGKSAGWSFWLPVMLVIGGGVYFISNYIRRAPTAGLNTAALPAPATKKAVLNLITPATAMSPVRSTVLYRITNQTNGIIEPAVNFIFQQLDGTIWYTWEDMPTGKINPGQTAEFSAGITIAKGWTMDYPHDGIFTIQVFVNGHLEDRIIKRVGVGVI